MHLQPHNRKEQKQTAMKILIIRMYNVVKVELI